MHISPDEIVLLRIGRVNINATLTVTWVLMLLMTVASGLVTRRISTQEPITRKQAFLETLAVSILGQIRDIGLPEPEKYLGFIGSLFLFIAVSNFLIIVPGYEPPTASLSTTAALAFCVFLAVPFYGIMRRGFRGYASKFIRPNPIMLPLNLMSEFSRTLALAVRLFGNVMSESTIAAILLSVAPLFFPVLVKILGLLTGMVQAYIFAVLATVYIAAATQASEV